MTSFADIIACERICHHRLIALPLGAERDAARERHREAAAIVSAAWNLASRSMPPRSEIGRITIVDDDSIRAAVSLGLIDLDDLLAGIPA